MEDTLNEWRNECHQVESRVRKHYASVPLTEEHDNKVSSYLVYCSSRGAEYFKVFFLMKTMSELEIILDEAMNLEFVGLEGFNDLINDEKKWEVLDPV